MKRHRTILLVAILSLTLLVMGARPYSPPRLTQPTFTQVRIETLQVRPVASVRLRAEENQRVILSGPRHPSQRTRLAQDWKA
jgi:hypothetical protein